MNRKNVSVLVCFMSLLLFTNNCYSQFKNIGFKAGVNLSSAKIDFSTLNIVQPKNKMGKEAERLIQ